VSTPSLPILSASSPPPRRCASALILKSDRFYAEAVRHVARQALGPVVIHTADSMRAAEEILETCRIDLLIAGLEPELGDVLAMIAVCGERAPATGVLLLAGHERDRVWEVLRSLPILGVFDAVQDAPGNLPLAVSAVGQGRTYWSPSIRPRLARAGNRSPARRLTATEELAFSIIGDGCDDVVAADALGLSAATMETVRRNLHRKLGVHQRGDLVRLAAQHGYVRFTADSVVRPGFPLLAAACAHRRMKPTPRKARGQFAREVQPAPLACQSAAGSNEGFGDRSGESAACSRGSSRHPLLRVFARPCCS